MYFRVGVTSTVSPEAINSITVAFALYVAFPSIRELVRISLWKRVVGVDRGGVSEAEAAVGLD
jgi:hypothetical protein